MNHALWWKRSTLLSLSLAAVLISLWVLMNQYQPESQLVNEQEVEKFLANNWANQNLDGNADDLVKIKTGIFIQSLDFRSASQVHLTGYIWQRYENNPSHTEIKDGIGMDGAGFILPEQVDQTEANEIYRKRFLQTSEVCENVAKGCPENQDWDEELIGWYFDATLRQPFDYDDYPFDHKTVWIRMWANDFANNIVLVPDFSSYDATGLDDIFGIENDIVLGTWEREDTYFDYYLASYSTNFGIHGYVGRNNFPDLRYNFVIKRHFESAFIVYLLPLFLVSILLFSALLTVSEEQDTSARHGFTTSEFIGAASALFFVVMLAHIQLRQEVGGSNIIYIEYFYILMYSVLVLATANTYLFSIRSTDKSGWLAIIHGNDNLIPKLVYWPIILSGLIIITLITLSL